MGRYVQIDKKLPALLQSFGRLCMEGPKRPPAHIFDPTGSLLEAMLKALSLTPHFTNRVECVCFVQKQLEDSFRAPPSTVPVRKRSAPASAGLGPDSEKKQKPSLA